MPPNATGAVSAINASATAFIGSTPRAINMTEQIATGPPPPASASSRAPNENAMTIACTRWSSEIELNDRRSTLKCPLWTVRL